MSGCQRSSDSRLSTLTHKAESDSPARTSIATSLGRPVESNPRKTAIAPSWGGMAPMTSGVTAAKARKQYQPRAYARPIP